MNQVVGLIIATAFSGAAAGASWKARTALHARRLAREQLEPSPSHSWLFLATVVVPLLLTPVGYFQLQRAFNDRDWAQLALGFASFGVTYWLCQRALAATSFSGWLRQVGSQPAPNGLRSLESERRPQH